MNITQSATTVASGGHEISLRTMASDVSSLERGSQQPIATHLVAPSSEPLLENSVKVSRQGISVVRLMLALLFLALVGIGIYLYVYPILIEMVKK
jgi:hypothetical protein